MYNDALKKNLAYLKSFVKWAKEKHYTVCEEFDSYKPKLPKGHISVKYLSLDELDRIYNLKLEEGSALDQTRDFFIFQCKYDRLQMLLFGIASYQYVLLLLHTYDYLFGAKVARIIELSKKNANFRAKCGSFVRFSQKVC